MVTKILFSIRCSNSKPPHATPLFPRSALGFRTRWPTVHDAIGPGLIIAIQPPNEFVREIHIHLFAGFAQNTAHDLSAVFVMGEFDLRASNKTPIMANITVSVPLPAV